MRIKLFSNLQKQLNFSRKKIETFSVSAPYRYKVYTIPKRNSGRRVIAHPSRELKVYQRAILVVLDKHLVSHQASYAYKLNTSIKDNAFQHMSNSYFLKLDFSNFFNSIVPDMFFTALNLCDIQLSDAELRLLSNLLFWNKTKSSDEKLVLSVGAPSSPAISNFVMNAFDNMVFDYCKQNSIVYTRYADDLTFSTNIKDILFDIPRFIKMLLGSLFGHRIMLNERKTVFSSKAHNRHVTGITITNDNSLSIGRARKRMISAMIHKYSLEQLDENESDQLRGLLAFAVYIEPDFLGRLENKYGKDLLTKFRSQYENIS